MLNSGRGVEADSAKAEQLYINCLAIIPNHARAHNNLASIYEDRLLRTQSKDGNLLAAMFHHYEEAAKGENAYAARNLARIYRTGNLVTKDLHKAYGFYEQATEWGLPEHHYDLGYMLETGEGVPLSYTEAAYHYRLASTNGQPSQDALERLCNLYLSYNLGPNDPARTAFWLEILLRYRKDSPQFVIREGELALVRYSNDDLRVELLDSLLQAKNYKLAINMLKDADENGSEYMASFACERLSQCYKNGLGVKPSPRKSKKYYEKALAAQNCDALLTLSNQQFQDGKIQDALESLKKAAHASGKACFTLGQLYYNGTYVKQNQPQAVKYMKKAVDHFCPEAYYFFAEAAYNGAYGAPSLDEAIRLAQRAQSSGYPQATELLEKLEKRRKSTNDGAPEETARARSS
jgi:TPR repeat protein